jgi:Fe2+ transport system protein FeoA
MAASPPLRLLDLGPRTPARVVALDPEHAARLGDEGLHDGDLVLVESRLPLGGPLIVRLGRGRLALARALARSILVEPEGTE